MKRLFYLSILLIFTACNNAESANNYQQVVITHEDTVTINDLSFNAFLSNFENETYPYHLKYGTNRLSYFDKDVLNTLELDVADQELDRKVRLSVESIKNWILNSEQDTELKSWLERNLTQIDDDWFAVEPGVRLKNANSYYLTLYTFEQTSAVNGGYWTAWLLHYSNSGELLETIELGLEGFYTFVDMKDTEIESYWKRYNDNQMITLNFESESEAEICTFNWTEIEGDIDITDKDYYSIQYPENKIELIIKNQKEKCWQLSDSLK